MQYSPSGSIKRILAGSLLPPGCCLNCGNGNADVYALLNTDAEVFYGSAYLCEGCARSTLLVFDEYDHAELKAQLDRTKQELENARSRFSNLYSNLRNLGLSDNLISVLADEEAVQINGNGFSAEQPELDYSGPERSESEVIESVNEQGPNDAGSTNKRGKSANV